MTQEKVNKVVKNAILSITIIALIIGGLYLAQLYTTIDVYTYLLIVFGLSLLAQVIKRDK